VLNDLYQNKPQVPGKYLGSEFVACLISTSGGKRLRANMHNGGHSCNSRNRQRPLLPHHSMRGDERGD
jgi:hypothetical protein